jgi:hypothetical protein
VRGHEKMIRILVSALIVLLAISLAKAQDADASKVGSFHISSFDTAFAVQGDFEGEYRVYPDRIELKVTKADIRVSEHCPYKGRRLLSALRFNLATSIDDRRWKTAYPGQVFPLEQVMSPGDLTSLGELYLNIPIDGSVDLSNYWVLVQMDATVLDAPEE